MRPSGRETETDLLDEAVEDGLVAPALHVLAEEGADLLPLGLVLTGRVLVEGLEEVLVKDEVLLALDVVDLDVGEVGVDTEAEVRGEGPGRGRPGEERGRRVVDEGKGDGD